MVMIDGFTQSAHATVGLSILLVYVYRCWGLFGEAFVVLRGGGVVQLVTNLVAAAYAYGFFLNRQLAGQLAWLLLCRCLTSVNTQETKNAKKKQV